jgi:dimethylargininase
MQRVLTRSPSVAIDRCELTHLERAPIDVARAQAQHTHYERCLERLGWTVEHLPPLDAHPDGVFVEDTAFVVPELAILTRPGAISRRGEVESVEAALRRYLPTVGIVGAATLDGGDVLRVGRNVYVGIGGRTNFEGADQLAAHLRPLGYSVVPLMVNACLHLKTAVCAIDDQWLVLNPAWIDATAFAAYGHVVVHEDEPFAANVLARDGVVLCSESNPRTAERIAQRYAIMTVDVSELEKAEAGLTCCSLPIPTF